VKICVSGAGAIGSYVPAQLGTRATMSAWSRVVLIWRPSGDMILS
jgi:ketopantoate reductase